MKKSILLASSLLLAASVFAQDDFGSFDDFGDFGSDGGSSGSGKIPVEIGGELSLGARLYVDQRNANDINDPLYISNFKTEAIPSTKLTFTYSQASSDIEAKLKFDKNSLLKNQWDILDEFTVRAFCGNLQLEAGKMRVVWGKGDKIHVLDNFNANDFSDYIIPDYIDRRIAEPMFRAIYSTQSNVKFEAIVTPCMTPDRLGTGVWEPSATKQLKSMVESSVKGTSGKLGMATKTLAADPTNPAAYFSQLNALTEAATFNVNDIYPDTYKIKYGQAGIRSTFTVGSVDLGVSYYAGRNKQPTVNKLLLSTFGGDISKIKDGNLLDYDVLQVFGVEGAYVIPKVGLNTRLEFAYNMTEDFEGNDPNVHNNSIAWVFGFDRDLPLHHVNLNIQTQGKVVLGASKINELGLFKVIDADYCQINDSGDSAWTNNKIILNVTDTWNYEKIKLDVKAIYGIERCDFILMPKLTFKVKDTLEFDVSGMYIWSKDKYSEFDGWEHNSFAQVSARYTF